MRIIKKTRNFFSKIAVKLGFYPRLNTPDRQYLENIILPFFSCKRFFNDILFIGCEWYTKYYENLFSNKNYHTIDNNLHKKYYGSKRHIIDKIQNIHKYFGEGTLSLIICNGVIGWGLNDPDEVENTLKKLYHCLKKDGILVIGWNNMPEHHPFLLENSIVLKKFMQYPFPPINHWRYVIESENAHVYDFYKKT